MSTFKLAALMAGSALATIAGAPQAAAQQAPDAQPVNAQPAADQTAQTSQGGLQDIVVTAQRREDSLQRTPLAITALSPADLQSRSVQSTQDLMQVTPGLQVSTQTAGNSGGSATFFLRGLGQQRSGNGTSPAVGVYIDDFYYPSLQGAIFTILDLQQVEVLRGPQGTLFGRNTIGGAIRYTTKQPDFTDSTGYVQATLGTFHRTDLTGSLNLALADNLALRVTGGRLREDGYVRQQNGGDPAGASATDLVRAQLRYQPTSKLEINLAGQYNRSDIDGFAYTVPGPITATSGLPAAWNHIPPGIANPYDSRYVSQCVYCQAGTNKRERSHGTYKSANATVVWHLSDTLSVKSLTGWQQVESSYLKDLDASPLPINDSVSSGIDRAFSQELQLNGDMIGDRLNWVLGGYYYNERHYDLYPEYGAQTNLGGTVPPTYLNTRTQTKAAFLDGTFKITDRLTAIGGIRYSVDSKTGVVSNVAGATVANAARDFDSTTWRAGLQMQWTPTAMTYATVSRGFRAGGFGKINGTSPVLNSFDPEYATNYEIGGRFDLFNHRLRFNPTAFYMKWTDIQVQRVVSGPTGVQIYVDNAAKAHSQGIELETEAAITSNFRLFGSLALLDIKYDEVGNTNAITLNTPFQRAPKVTYSLGASYHVDLEDNLRVTATTNWSYQARQYSTPSASDQLLLPAYGLLNARLEVGDRSGKWSVALFATNLTDKVYYVGGSNYAAAGTGTSQYDLGRPREFGVSMRVGF